MTLTALAALTGHALEARTTRRARPSESARRARNPGLALLVATLNSAPTGVVATVFAYLVISALTLVPYVAFSRRRGRDAQDATPP